MRSLSLAPVVIREYRPQDLSTLHRIDRVCFAPEIAFSRDELLFYVRHPNAVSRVAEREGQIVGFAVGRLEQEGAGHILTLDVVPDERRAGTGTVLMNALHGEFRSRRVAVAVLEVNAEDEGARRFYEKLEYEYVERVPGYYCGTMDAYRMICFL